MNVAIRSATDGDSAGIVSLIRQWKSDGSEDTFDESPLTRAVRDCVQSGTTDVLVGEASGRVLGYIVVHWIPFPMIGGTEGYISDVIVDRAARGIGLGTRLVASVEAMARDRGTQRLMLNNRISDESFVRGFYPKLGFRWRNEFANFVKVLA